jgi:abortive phage resistance protein AbiGi (putative antitoxin)
MTGEHTGSVLFHCWRHDPPERARAILSSIVRNGFLLTTTNRGALDGFVVRDGENHLRRIEVMQRARICFTDIPIDLLAIHGASYGRYGVGFSRDTIVSWGGCPAWYLPNHHGGDTLKDNGPVLVNGLHAAMVALESFQAVVNETERLFKSGQLKEHFFTQRFTHGKALAGDALVSWLSYAKNCVDRALSFVKEMSPSDSEDFRYLYEREWRIVEGFQIQGKDPFRLLTDVEKTELCSANPNWAKPAAVSDINVQMRYPSAPIVDSFRYFNGWPSENERVSHKIDVVLVPNDDEKAVVQRLISEASQLFKAQGPEVMVFPD